MTCNAHCFKHFFAISMSIENVESFGKQGSYARNKHVHAIFSDIVSPVRIFHLTHLNSILRNAKSIFSKHLLCTTNYKSHTHILVKSSMNVHVKKWTQLTHFYYWRKHGKGDTDCYILNHIVSLNNKFPTQRFLLPSSIVSIWLSVITISCHDYNGACKNVCEQKWFLYCNRATCCNFTTMGNLRAQFPSMNASFPHQSFIFQNHADISSPRRETGYCFQFYAYITFSSRIIDLPSHNKAPVNSTTSRNQTGLHVSAFQIIIFQPTRTAWEALPFYCTRKCTIPLNQFQCPMLRTSYFKLKWSSIRYSAQCKSRFEPFLAHDQFIKVVRWNFWGGLERKICNKNITLNHC